MRIRRLAGLAAGIAAVAAVPVAAQAGSGTDRATGGGQTLVGTQGAGNTIAFTAQGTQDAARGQVQVVNREAGTGRQQVRFHGTVTCLRVEGNTAELAGVGRDGGAFTLYVVDNGEGANADNDLISFTRVADPSCDRDDSDDDGSVELARGNAQVYDAG
jgi:hypothetical protein